MMRFVLIDHERKMLAGQAYVGDLEGKWGIFDFSDHDGDFISATLDAVNSLGDEVVSFEHKGSA